MREKITSYTERRPRLKKSLGWVLVVFGFVALITPLTPGGLLFFVGLELLGIKLFLSDRLLNIFLKKKKSVPVLAETAEIAVPEPREQVI